jgi:hypothetical protein
MTLPDERYRAIIYTKNFLQDLLNPKITPKVPKNIRQRAYSLLRHFPEEFYLSMLADARPDILERKGESFDPLYKMIKEFDLTKETK